VWSALLTVDRAVAATRPAWGWAAEVALVWLGAHLVADRLDDTLAWALTHAGVAWPEPEWPLTAATWGAVGLELLVGALAVWIRLRGSLEPVGLREWLRRLHPGAVADPLFVGATGLAGAWVLAMGVEDALAATWPAGASPAAAVVGAAVALRFALPAASTVARSAPLPRRRTDGWARALLLLPFAALAARHGWPVWGVLP
jgi:hypothetical protein